MFVARFTVVFVVGNDCQKRDLIGTGRKGLLSWLDPAPRALARRRPRDVVVVVVAVVVAAIVVVAAVVVVVAAVVALSIEGCCCFCNWLLLLLLSLFLLSLLSNKSVDVAVVVAHCLTVSDCHTCVA